MKLNAHANGLRCSVRGLTVSFGGVFGPSSAWIWGLNFQVAKTAMIDTRFNYHRLT